MKACKNFWSTCGSESESISCRCESPNSNVPSSSRSVRYYDVGSSGVGREVGIVVVNKSGEEALLDDQSGVVSRLSSYINQCMFQGVVPVVVDPLVIFYVSCLWSVCSDREVLERTVFSSPPLEARTHLGGLVTGSMLRARVLTCKKKNGENAEIISRNTRKKAHMNSSLQARECSCSPEMHECR